MDSIPEKKCTKCERFFPATTEYFHRMKEGKYGVGSWCKECAAKKKKEHYQPHKRKVTTSVKIYQQIHKEEKLAYDKEYNRTHREQIRIREKEYWQSHPEQLKANTHNHRARKLTNGGTHTAEDIQKQYTNQKGKCYYCSKKVGKKYDVDHIIPLSKGGSNSPENLVIACPSCNRAKKDKLPHEWFEGGRLL